VRNEIEKGIVPVLNCNGTLLDCSVPLVMGILNTTPDSFYDGGRYDVLEQAVTRGKQLWEEGATLIDVGGASSRPGALEVSVEEELRRVIPVIRALHVALPEAVLSVDTWRAEVAAAAVEAGASLINDISAGELDEAMLETVAALGVPYVLMHMQGRPDSMQLAPMYSDVVVEVLDFLIKKVIQLRELGVKDILIDPGFGFGKTIEHNFELLRRMGELKTVLQLPVLAGISRKSMIYKTLGSTASEALNGTSALHMVALQQGADILRVHDVKEAVEVRTLFRTLYPE
jgi:dihydropteroate synthase